jgi:hypothetical protein
MSVRASNLDRFLRAVHRRQVAMHAAESGGIGAAVGAAFGMILAAALLWQGRDAMIVCAAAVGLGAVAGAITGILRRPTLHAAATRADQQLDLADLLASAVAARESEDPWQRAVVAMAEQRCAMLAPNAVILHRFGGRAWGAIALVVALTLTLGALSMAPADSPARAAEHVASRPAPFAPPPVGPVTSTPAPTRAMASAGSRHAPPERTAPGAETPSHERDDSGGDASAERSSSANRSNPNASGTGEGVGRTDSPSQRLETASPGGGTSSRVTSPTISGGGRSRATATEGVDGAAGALAAPQPSAAPAPAWQSSPSAADAAAAEQAVRQGRVPDAYRDVLKAYFRPEEPTR